MTMLSVVFIKLANRLLSVQLSSGVLSLSVCTHLSLLFLCVSMGIGVLLKKSHSTPLLAVFLSLVHSVSSTQI